VLYEVDHRAGTFFIVTNANGHGNFRLVTCPVATPSPEHWTALPTLDAPSGSGNSGGGSGGGGGGGHVFGDGSDLSPGAAMLEGVTCFKDHLVLHGRANGYTKVWVAPFASADTASAAAPVAAGVHEVAFPDAACDCGVGPNKEFDSPVVRLSYSSLVAPPSALDYTPATRALATVKQQEVPHYDPSQYGTARLVVTASDGAQVPVSLVFHKSVLAGGKDDGVPASPAPLHLYGYGSYGACIDPFFSAKRLPLLDRGVVYAIAHVRGGSEMGRAWYEQQVSEGKLVGGEVGKGWSVREGGAKGAAKGRGAARMPCLCTAHPALAQNARPGIYTQSRSLAPVCCRRCAQGKYLAKRNTFSDFVACAEALHAHGWSVPGLTSTEGRSAGGLLMGTVLNERPDLFKAAVRRQRLFFFAFFSAVRSVIKLYLFFFVSSCSSIARRQVAGVPFVDVMTTMCDASIPLTVGEWEEWGNPNDAKYFSYMKSYSPMENVVKQRYPALLVTAGLFDPRVQYWEPMKWVAKLRDHKTDANPLLLKV